MQFLWFIIIGAVAGWLAGLIMKGGGFGIISNIIVGILGAIVGGWIFGLLGISAGGELVGSLVTAVVGAVILLFVVGLVKEKALRLDGLIFLSDTVDVNHRSRNFESSPSS